MILLAIDTAASLCAACVFDSDRGEERGRSVRDIGKGHAEQLMDVVGEALAAAQVGYASLGAIAVSVGPGSFTGIRVGVATARGLSLALQIPASGITTLDALAAEARAQRSNAAILAAIDAGRDGLYVALYDPLGKQVQTPSIATLEEAGMLASEDGVLICGSAAAIIAAAIGRPDKLAEPLNATADIATYARLASTRPLLGEKPKPLYLRAPDAKPQPTPIRDV